MKIVTHVKDVFAISETEVQFHYRVQGIGVAFGSSVITAFSASAAQINSAIKNDVIAKCAARTPPVTAGVNDVLVIGAA
jgi:hypothetical protein